MTKNVNEDSYFADKIKRTAQGAASKLLPGGLGGDKAKVKKEIRERANQLLKVWKEQEAAGRQRNLRNVQAWLRSGNDPISPTVFKNALTSVNKTVDLSDVDNELSTGELRDIFRGIAQQERQQTATVDITQTKLQQAARERKANKKTSTDNTKRSKTNTRRSKDNSAKTKSNRDVLKTQFDHNVDQMEEIRKLKQEIQELKRQIATLRQRGE